MSLQSLYLVRHGHTVWHETGGVAGRSDIALSDNGRLAVQQLAAPLARLCAEPQAWYCSPMLRTRQSSALLREHWRGRDAASAVLSQSSSSDAPTESVSNLPEPLLDERLVELDFGDWEGMTWADVHTRHGEIMQAWAEDWVNRSPPGGERFSEQVERCGDWLADASESLETGEPAAAVVVSHGGSIRALLCQCLGWPLTRAMNFRVDPASVCHLQRDEQGVWMVRRINVRRDP